MKPKKEIVLKGIAISPGVRLGKVVKMEFWNSKIKQKKISKEKHKKEFENFVNALTQLKKESERILVKYSNNKSIKDILETELLFLQDNELLKSIKDHIYSGNTAYHAVEKFFESYLKVFNERAGSFLDYKVEDINFLKQKILQRLSRPKKVIKYKKNSIIVSSLLSSDEVLKVYENGAMGLVTENGSNLSHSSIISRSLNIPAVFRVENIISKINNEDSILVDGNLGEVYINPSPVTLKRYEKDLDQQNLKSKSDLDLSDIIISNRKGNKINLFSNINNIVDLKNALKYNSDGVGLVRTENLIPDINSIFDLDYQTEIYSRIAESMYPKPVSIRLFDFGYDKLSLSQNQEQNPALGLRGIRYLLKDKRILRFQIEAILKASLNKNVNILIPLVNSPLEILSVKEEIDSISKKLKEKHDQNIQVGSMIETPASALNIAKIIKFVDFVSIGTNDLMQYTFAADRTNEDVEEYLNYKDNSMIYLLNKVKNIVQKNKKSLTVCGQLSSDLNSLEFLIKKGFTNFSVVPNMIPDIKKFFVK